MHILLVEYELHLPECHSLKEKRHVIKPLLNEIRRDYNVSAAEVEFHDVWQQALLAVVCVGNLKPALEKNERQLTALLDSHESAVLVDVRTQWL